MIDLADIQSIVAAPTRSRSIDLHFLHFRTPEALATFLDDAAGNVTSAAAAVAATDTNQAVNVGISGAGIRLASIPSRAYDALPPAFVAGMRSAAPRLGDVGPSRPERWDDAFNDAGPVIHAVVIRFDDAPRDLLDGGADRVVVTSWHGARRENDVEAFGFRDGISDPVIDGSGRPVTPGNGVWDAAAGRWRSVRSGEAVMGYTDESGMIAGHPDAALIERNGSYLVARKLEQDVARFHEACALEAAKHGGELTGEDVEARMVGRHKDGVVLGGSRDDAPNDFRYGDGSGPSTHVSPAAHIRRANPRDGIAAAEAIVPRHQLFRRGLPYRDEQPPAEGLLFLACCADLRRQFEFVQSQWMQDGLRFGLGHERDGLIGGREVIGGAVGEQHHVSVPGADGRRVPLRLPSFVTTRGGEYFLLPGKLALAHLAEELSRTVGRRS